MEERENLFHKLSVSPGTFVQVDKTRAAGQDSPNVCCVDAADISHGDEDVNDVPPASEDSDTQAQTSGVITSKLEKMMDGMLKMQKMHMDAMLAMQSGTFQPGFSSKPTKRKMATSDAESDPKSSVGEEGAPQEGQLRSSQQQQAGSKSCAAARPSDMDTPRAGSSQVSDVTHAKRPRLQNEACKHIYGDEHLSADDDSDDDFDNLCRQPEQSDEDEELDISSCMQEFEKSFSVGEQTGPKINDQLATTVNGALRGKLRAETKTKILDLYKRPENVNNLVVPKVNSEIWQAISQQKGIKAREFGLMKMQGMLSHAMSATLKSTDILMTAMQNTKQSVSMQNALKCNTDCLRIMTGLFAEFSVSRRQNIKRVLKDRFRSICSSENPVTDQLFGDDLAKKMKEIRETKNAEFSWKDDRPSFTRGRGRYRDGHQFPLGHQFSSNSRGRNQQYPNQKRNWPKQVHRGK